MQLRKKQQIRRKYSQYGGGGFFKGKNQQRGKKKQDGGGYFAAKRLSRKRFDMKRKMRQKGGRVNFKDFGQQIIGKGPLERRNQTVIHI